MSCLLAALLDIETTLRSSLMLVLFQREMADRMQLQLNLVKMLAEIVQT